MIHVNVDIINECVSDFVYEVLLKDPSDEILKEEPPEKLILKMDNYENRTEPPS